MTEDRILALVNEVANEYGYGEDQFVEDVAEAIIEDNGLSADNLIKLTDEEVKELAAQFFEEDDE